MLLDDDIVTDREPEPGTLTRRFRREEGIEYLFLDLGRNADAVIANRDLYAIAEVLRRGSEGWLIPFAVGLLVALGSRSKGRLVAIAVGLRFPLGRRRSRSKSGLREPV